MSHTTSKTLRIITTAITILVAVSYATWITTTLGTTSEDLLIGMWFIHIPTVAFLFISLIFALSPDWHKAEF